MKDLVQVSGVHAAVPKAKHLQHKYKPATLNNHPTVPSNEEV